MNDKALRLNANDPRLHAQRGEILGWAGRPEDAIESLELAMRLDPYEGDGWAHLLGRSFYDAGQHKEAIDAFKRVARPVFWHHAYLAASHAQLGETTEAEREREECLKLRPDFSISGYCQTLNYENLTACIAVREGMGLAGLPE